ncbi:MAG: hypothetical protein IRY93_05615 [Chthoniobacterales bacterium]|jgi:hypothetical protein|nr:hypothetical protein [Chthoniobacterales bacterium]
MMKLSVRQVAMAVAAGALLFGVSCQERPLGQMPEVQREQPDPAKLWTDSEKREPGQSSPAPVEMSPQTR